MPAAKSLRLSFKLTFLQIPFQETELILYAETLLLYQGPRDEPKMSTVSKHRTYAADHATTAKRAWFSHISLLATYIRRLGVNFTDFFMVCGTPSPYTVNNLCNYFIRTFTDFSDGVRDLLLCFPPLIKNKSNLRQDFKRILYIQYVGVQLV